MFFTHSSDSKLASTEKERKNKKNAAQMRHSCTISSRKRTRVLIRHHSPVTSNTSDTNDTNDTNLIGETLVVSPGRFLSQKCSDTPFPCVSPDPQGSCAAALVRRISASGRQAPPQHSCQAPPQHANWTED